MMKLNKNYCIGGQNPLICSQNHNGNTMATQHQHCSKVGHENDFAHPPPHHHRNSTVDPVKYDVISNNKQDHNNNINNNKNHNNNNNKINNNNSSLKKCQLNFIDHNLTQY